MTLVGKILVIIIMVFAIVFLTVSVVVFTTAKNWKEESATNKTQIQKIQGEVNQAKAESDRLNGELEQAKQAHETVVGQFEADKAVLEASSNKRQEEITEQRQLLETALSNTKIAVQDAEDRKKETELLREQLAAVQKQSNEFKLAQTELNDRIRILERELDVAKTNNSDLREQVGIYQSVIRAANLSTDTSKYTRAATPPDVEGYVKRVGDRGKRVEISIGSDDGLFEGAMLYVYRLQGSDPGYIGKIKIDLVDPDSATGSLDGRTQQGKSFQEGDSVSTQIRPRG